MIAGQWSGVTPTTMMKNYYLLIFLLSEMGAGMLKAEKTLSDFDREPFEQPLIRPGKTLLSPAAARVEAYMESLPPGERENASVPCLVQVKDVAANSWPGVKGKAGTDWIAAELFFQLNGCSVSLERQLFQNARKPVVPVGSRLLFSGSLPAGVLRNSLLPGETYENPERADKICRAVFKNLKKAEGTPPSIPDMAPALQGKYMKKNPAAAVVPAALLKEIAGDGYSVRSESLPNGMRAVVFSSGAEESCLAANRRWMELVPLPEEDYFIVINHLDGHTATLLLYRVVRHEHEVSITDEGTAEASLPEISVECVYRAPAIYNVVWWLGGWDYEGNVMRVVRREMMEKQGYETVFYDVPIR